MVQHCVGLGVCRRNAGGVCGACRVVLESTCPKVCELKSVAGRLWNAILQLSQDYLVSLREDISRECRALQSDVSRLSLYCVNHKVLLQGASVWVGKHSVTG